MFIIMCRVSGGVTGTREAPLKGPEGLIKRFSTREAAETEAAQYNREMGRYSMATFRYWVEEAS